MSWLLEGFVPRGDFRCSLSDLRESKVVGHGLIGRRLREGLERGFGFDFGYFVSGKGCNIC